MAPGRLTKLWPALLFALAQLPASLLQHIGRHCRRLGPHGLALRFLLLLVTAGSGAGGYLIGQAERYAPHRERWLAGSAVWRHGLSAGDEVPPPVLGALRIGASEGAESRDSWLLPTPSAASALDERIGQLRAELIALSLLFRRLVEQVGLDASEFEIPDEPLTRHDSQPSHRIDLLNRSAAHMKVAGRQLARVLGERELDERLTISGRPVSKVVVSSGYGIRMHPVYGSRRMHHGIDYRGRPGDPIFAVADGIVTFSGRNGSYGNLVELEHSDGYLTRYAHNQTNLVDVGELVRKGDTIAHIGSTGRTTGPHLHFEVRNRDGAVDPLVFVR